MVDFRWKDRMSRVSWPGVQDVSWSKALAWAAYPAFFLICFLLFAYWTFPYNRLKDRIIEIAEDQGYELDIVDIAPSRLSGLTLEGVRLAIPNDADGPPLDVVVDELTVRASLLSALSDTKSFFFDAELAGGETHGDVAIGDESFEIDTKLSDIELKQLPALRAFTKVPLTGTLDGEVLLNIPPEVGESTGEVSVSVQDLNVGDGETKIEVPGWGGLTLDEANAGNLEVRASIENGTATIERFKTDGRDLKLDVLGNVRLARPTKRSQLDLIVKAKIEDAYKERSPKVATMLELAANGRDYKAALTPDGSLQYKVNGSAAGRLRPRPAGKSAFEAPRGQAKRP